MASPTTLACVLIIHPTKQGENQHISLKVTIFVLLYSNPFNN